MPQQHLLLLAAGTKSYYSTPARATFETLSTWWLC
jgi:hypothetical protein